MSMSPGTNFRIPPKEELKCQKKKKCSLCKKYKRKFIQEHFDEEETRGLDIGRVFSSFFQMAPTPKLPWVCKCLLSQESPEGCWGFFSTC